ncbi:MAG: GC-type dockerin domain-anchored protein [Phycisphaerales bacterium JB060]
MTRTIAPATLLALAGATLAQSGPIALSFDAPTRDRWNYPFSATPGTRTNATIFGATGIEGFDDRDAQFIVGFDTAGQVPTGLGAGAFRVVSARVTLVIENNLQFVYDDTPDALASFFDPADPDYVEDATPGRPIELYATGYRNGFTIESWEETSEFGGIPIVPPAEGARNAFAAFYTGVDGVVDLSRQVRERIESTPLAIGQTDGVAVGEFVPAETVFTFDIDTCVPGAAAFFDSSFDAGKLNLTVTSMHDAELGSTQYPAFFTKENAISPILGYSPRLELTVIAFDDADINGDGELDIFDFLAFQNAFDAGDPLADFDGNCTLDIFDFLAFQNAFDAG